MCNVRKSRAEVTYEWTIMANYFRWIKGSKKEESPYQKPRSRSLDAKSLELSGIKLLLHHVGTISDTALVLTRAASNTARLAWLQTSPWLPYGCNPNARLPCGFKYRSFDSE